MNTALKIAVREGVATVRLDRPEADNAIDNNVMGGLLDFARALIKDSREARAIVTSGNSKSFCADLDCRQKPRRHMRSQALLNDAATVDVARGLAQEAAVTHRLLGTPNQVEAIAATSENREPQFAVSEEKL